MRDGRLSANILVAGLLSLALGACGNATTGSGGSGGTTSASGGSGGGQTGGSGGTTTVATASGGTSGSGGTTSQPASGGKTGSSGGTTATGGAQETGGTVAGSGGRLVGSGGRIVGSGGTSTEATGGAVGTGGAGLGGSTTGAANGGAVGTGGRATGGAAGGGAGTGGTTGGRGGSTGTGTGTCTASKAASVTVSGSGPHKVVVESNSDTDIACGTIYRPADLGGTEKYPIFVWGEGACTRSGTSNQAAMGEIASHGFFVVADGPAGSAGANCGTISMPSTASDLPNMAKPLLGYIAWATAENDKPCSAYYQSLDPTKVAADGFSCGGLMSEGTASDSRMTTWGVTSSGLTSADQAFYKKVHTPVKVLLGGTSDIAYTNGERDYDNISALGIPIILFSKNLGHGGDLGKANGGDFTKVNLAWLNWQLKADLGATGKGFLVGDTCTFCKDTAWEVKSKNLP